MKSDNIDAESRRVLELIAKHPGSVIALDTEATGIRVAAGEDTCIGASIAAVIGNNAFSHYFPFRHEVGDNIGTETFNLFKQVMEEGQHTFVYVNAQFDILSLETVGVYLGPEKFYDIPTMAHLIGENKPFAKSLDQLSQHYIDKNIGKVKLGKLTLSHIDQYNALCAEHKVKNPPSPILFPDYTEDKHKGRVLPTDFLV